MKIEGGKAELLQLINIQLSLFLIKEKLEIIESYLDEVLSRIEFCFKHTSNKYYSKNNEVYFNPFHSGQWSIFLYYLSNTLFTKDNSNRIIADKIYYLNKTLNGFDILYEIELPAIFMLDHPVGTVLGRAEYSEYFSFCQGCTVGNNHGKYPQIGKNVSMLADSKIIGDCIIGENVIISANTYIKDQSIPSNSIVFGSSPNLIIKQKKL